MVTIQCDWCGAEISRYPSLVHPRNFCNRECQGKYRSEHYTSTRAANWQGGQKKDRERVQWFMPWHHRADNKGYVFRYVISAELSIGRPLAAGEVIHHIDGDPANDHPDNLQVLASQSEHARIHGLQRPVEMMNNMRNARRKAS